MTAENLLQKNTDLVTHVDTNIAQYTRLGWLIIIAGLGGFLLWASLAPLDKGVPLVGTVAVASNKKAIQHESGGTVDEILVEEGDLVKTGDILIRMNGVQANAEAESAHAQYIAARITEARLTAEMNHQAGVKLPAELETAKQDPRVIESMALQNQLSSSRQAAIKSELSSIDENIAGLLSQMHGLESSVVSKNQQKASVNAELVGMRDLAKEGYLPNNRVLESEQNLARIDADIATDVGNIARSKRQVAELNLQKMQRTQEYQKEVRTQLSEVQKQANSLGSQLKGLNRHLENVEIKAPVAGTVVGLNVFTKGAVVSPGFKLMDIVPKEDGLVVDGQLPVNLVDKVYAGLPVNMLFTAFNQNKTPRIPGVITNVSADRFVDEHTGQAYYKVTSKVAPEGLKLIGALKIRPGMPVELFIVTGERTMMNYLFKPIFDRLKLSMSEE
jgi:membrane fusion protein, protease secretion system